MQAIDLGRIIMTYQNIEVEVKGPIAFVRLNRPDKRNALSIALRQEVVDCLGALSVDDSVVCLILTGNIYPSPIILSRAEELGVPIILVRHDTFTAAQLIDQVFGRSRFCQERKINLFGKLLDDQFDFRRFYDALGLPGSG